MDNILLGKTPLNTVEKKVSGGFIQIADEKFYQITNYDCMQPFFISLASDSNHWLYISSNGGLTAGRKNPDMALFPYYTDDKITDSAEITGSKTILHVENKHGLFLWEPFSDRNKGVYAVERSLAKSTIGNKLIFTEINHDLGLTFSYIWMNSDKFGWIKKSILTNNSSANLKIYVVDGVLNLLPSGIDRLTQNTFSTLVDGYKKTELIDNSSIALYRMESILVDRAEPSESLRANIAWSTGLKNSVTLLSSAQLKAIQYGEHAKPEREAKGVRGAYFTCATIELSPNVHQTWYTVLDVYQDIAQINNLDLWLGNQNVNIGEELEKSVAEGTTTLLNIVSQADGIQKTNDEAGDARHFSNVLFNTMRGGIYNDNYRIDRIFFSNHIHHFNIACYLKNKDFLNGLPDNLEYKELEVLVLQQNDVNLYRLYLEYLPLTFSRRHGDPSRPWNLFNINIKDDTGNKILSYQGNWRDIFQNWEALSTTYPGYVNGIIAKFLNATTADGYNPYKVTNDGFEWEVIEPENPWSNIGYWGDHQIIYLEKLLEVSQKYYPEKLQTWIDKDIFSYANVPYRIKSFDEIVADPKNSITFDNDLHNTINRLQPAFGADAKLMLDGDQNVVHASFTEKILVTYLTKISNFIPDAGIWMNTLRPEWNDANNALVGWGASMVTLYYMRRFANFVVNVYKHVLNQNVLLSEEVFNFFEEVFGTLINYRYCLDVKQFDSLNRFLFVRELGKAGEKYRNSIYNGFCGMRHSFSVTDLVNFLELSIEYIDNSIANNKRPDGMYHSYNLISFVQGEIHVRNLYEMLEGQVAVLSSGVLSSTEVVSVLDALRTSALYREDQCSYILYPNKKLPELTEKNNISESVLRSIPLLVDLVDKNDTSIVVKDQKGLYHFNAAFNNATFLKDALIKLQANQIYAVSDETINEILNVYEQIFDHQSFTGRSGTFYKYEGLGCIYWHMVSKLLLSIGENLQNAVSQKVDKAVIQKLQMHYDEVKDGIGAHKSPDVYGSFPFDPYSHTPTMAGVQQPGMTGQVKEDILNRFNELGIVVANGQIAFRPFMLKQNDFIDENSNRSLQFTFCGVHVCYQLDNTNEIEIHFLNNVKKVISGLELDKATSQQIFNRDKSIIEICIKLSSEQIFG